MNSWYHLVRSYNIFSSLVTEFYLYPSNLIEENLKINWVYLLVLRWKKSHILIYFVYKMVFKSIKAVEHCPLLTHECEKGCRLETGNQSWEQTI